VLHQIGVGALGPVFRTYEPSRDRLVAVKVFRLDITPEQAQTLADELTRSAEAGLLHPSIVEPVAAGVQGTVAYRADEYVPAESLDVAMSHYAPASADKVLPFITQLAGAIDFARAAGIGHGALHPRDIFVTPEEARATGFGVVDALERVGLRAPVRRPYSPPERIAGGTWGTPADVFSLAAIAFEMLTGRRPSGTGDQIGAIESAALRAVLGRAMHDDPAKRYSTALAFAEALEKAARGELSPVDLAAMPEAAPATVPDAAPTIAPIVAEIPVAEPRATVPEKADVPAPTYVGPAGAEFFEEVDDITAEREEDAAHWTLAQQEQLSSEIEAEEPTELFADEQVEAAADTLALDAADLALDEAPVEEPRFRVGFETERATPPRRPTPLELDLGPRDEPEASKEMPAAPGRSFIPIVVPPSPASRAGSSASASRSLHDTYDRPLSGEQSGESQIVVERPRTAMLPLAVALMVGLLLGFGWGYVVGGRNVTDSASIAAGATESSGTTATATPTGSGERAPAGREWSEQAVSQPAARPGATAPPPDVPRERPAAAPGGASATTAPPAARTGRIVVRSTPSRASVTVNGTWRGRTPLTLDDLAFGPYVVRVVADGYQVRREEFKLSADDASRTLSMRLERQPAARGTPSPAAPRSAARGTATNPGPRPETGANTSRAYFGMVFVDSRPQGARVYIDRKAYGTTPLRIPEVPIGSHIVRLELPDHSGWTKPIQVTAGQEVRVTGSLDPIR
jgi:hypothetical protein